jgi:hypothetical protein
MAVISVPEEASWFAARWAFAELLERSRQLLASDPDLQGLIDAAEANDGLHLGRLAPDDASRIAAAVRAAARQIAGEIPADSSDPRRRSFREELQRLDQMLGRRW